MSEQFEPALVQVVEDTEQLKAFTSPIRIRLMIVLAERAATNQQLANLIGEPQAKVLYHLRALLEMGLIKLVDTQIKGGNVEKYYRAVARTFQLRLTEELRPGVVGAELSVLTQEVEASAFTWPETPPQLVIRGRRVTPEAAREFFGKLQSFIDDYWHLEHESEASDLPQYYCAAVVFRGERQEQGD